jgi:methionyl-tRNA synthetase
MKPFYVTTPIYYPNDRPHLGTAYSTIAADVLARYHRLRGEPTRFLTGLDEHGLKTVRAAEDAKLEPQRFVDSMTPAFHEAWKLLHCAYDDFVRTTEPRHKERAQLLWKLVAAKGDIYLGQYEDWYCVGCESFKTEKDLLEGKLCPEHKRPVERIKEESYFFRLSQYQDKLLDYYQAHPELVRPAGRFNEVKSFVREGLRDLSISRTSFRWGVPVPGDDRHVMYVWFDALTNYITTLGGPASPGSAPLYDQFWPPGGRAVHVVGKDILRFHAVYWPAMLLSAGLPLPTQVLAHGWLTVNGEKMSKTLRNVVQPGPLVEAFGADVLRYYLMREVALGQDGDFSTQNVLARYHGELGNGVGNLLNRLVTSIVQKNLGSEVPARHDELDGDLERDLRQLAERVAVQAGQHLEEAAPQRAMETIWELVGSANRYVDRTEPWALAKRGQTAQLEHVVYHALEALRFIGLMLWPYMPVKADALLDQLGLPGVVPEVGREQWPTKFGVLRSGTAVRPGAPLFPRYEEPAQQALLERFGKPKEPSAMQTPPQAAPETGSTAGSIEYDDFTKVDLRVALVLTAERVPKSDKLLRLTVDAGDGAPRQIVAGIAQHYTPEAMVGKRVVIVANLKPRKLMGLLSQGMVLAAGDGERLLVASVDGEPAPGSKVK